MTQATVAGLKALADLACAELVDTGEMHLVEGNEDILHTSDAYCAAALKLGYIWDAVTLSWVKA
jgi:hypothetical protein